MGREGESKCCCVMLVEVMLGDHNDRMLLVCYEVYHGNVLSLSRMEGMGFEYLRWKLTADGDDDDDDDGTETPRPSLPSMRYLAKSLFRQRT